MARKSLDQLSPAYRRRIERAEAKGKTRQQARGHKAREHVERRQKEAAKSAYELSKDQEASIHRWWNRNTDPDRVEAGWPTLVKVLSYAGYNGYAEFQNYRNIWNAARTEYLRAVRNGTYVSKGEGYLLILKDMTKVPEISWMYYH